MLCGGSGGFYLVKESILQDSKFKRCRHLLPHSIPNTPYSMFGLSQPSPLGTISCFQSKGLITVVSSEHLLSHLCLNCPNPPPLKFRQCRIWVQLKVLNSSEQVHSPLSIPFMITSTSVRWRCAHPCPRVQGGQEAYILTGA